ncbi:hypothetical protein Pint_32766 [Pistacia integerrima]|uniref:Uncharacterized protein n=1 Tax=Pistacia integerrima TaxID=434235 RepID=A0ACC0XMB8_9ROSI|nr:hypothetical protein Pint_32766 [Pistacia integerrima]
MLEVACGRRPMEPGMVDLAAWVIDCWKRGAILDVSDPRLEGVYVEKQMESVLKLGLICSHSNPETRPSMKQVTRYLDGEAKLPSITPKSAVIGAITARNEVPDIVLSFDSLPESISSHTLSSVDSVLVLGR